MDYDGVEGVISLGGPESVATGAERPDWMEGEMGYLRGAHGLDLPVIGVCLGHQILATALGGEVSKMETPEVGVRRVDVIGMGYTDVVLAGVSWESVTFFCHEDEVTKTPDGATTLMSNERCPIQAFRIGMRTYGFQQDFIAGQKDAKAIVHGASALVGRSGVSHEEIFADLEARYPDSARFAERMCVNIATFLFSAMARTGV